MTPLRCTIGCHRPDDGAAHLDLFLEQDGRLLTWRLPLSGLPPVGGSVPAQALPDHRLPYLDFEGAIGRGLGAITVDRQGTWERVGDAPFTFRVCWGADEETYRLQAGELQRLE